VEGTKAENAAQSAFAAPITGRSDGQWAGDVVFMIVNNKAERPIQILNIVNLRRFEP